MTRHLLSGNQAVGEAVRLARAQVVAAYPITPQTTIVEHLAEAVGKGDLLADFITVESEHSAMAASVGASIAGARAFTATSSQGLALMHEMLHWASGQRTPVVMANVNRALAPPWNIWVDHSDSMAQRDTGWIQVYAETNQEVLDTILQVYRLAEDKRVMVPAMVMLDAFSLSHTYMPVDVPELDVIDRYLPPYSPPQKVLPETTQLFGSFSPPELCYMELRHDLEVAMHQARILLPQVEEEYTKLTGHPSFGAVDEYRTDDAEVVLMAMGSLAATARDAVDALRREGKKVGLARMRLFRPFPADAVRSLGERFHRIAVLDRAVSYGSGGPLAGEVRAALLGIADSPVLAAYIAGLGGREVTQEQIRSIFERLLSGNGLPSEEWVGLKVEG